MNKREFFEAVGKDPQLFVIEGCEFSGKSSVCQYLSTEFAVYRLPGATPIGEKCRNIFKEHSNEISPLAMYHIICAADAEFFATKHKIEKPVLLDRMWISRIVYQHTLQGFSEDKIYTDMFELYNKKLPCKTVVLTCSEKTLIERKACRNTTEDIFDSRALIIRELYLDITKEPWFSNWCIEISTDNKTVKQVAEEVKEYFCS